MENSFRFRRRSFFYLLRAREGATIIEFAIIAPVLLLLVFAIIEFGMIMFTSSVVEGVTSIAARQGKTGFAINPSERAREICRMFGQKSGGFLSYNNLHICTQSADSFINGSPIRTCTAPAMNCEAVGSNVGVDAGVGGRVVFYTVTYDWKILTPMLLPFFPNAVNGKIPLTSTVTVKNEGF